MTTETTRETNAAPPGESHRETGPAVTVVIPTIGRPSLAATLAAVGRVHGHGPEVIVVDDRPGESPEPLPVPGRVRVLRSGGRGPATWAST